MARKRRYVEKLTARVMGSSPSGNDRNAGMSPACESDGVISRLNLAPLTYVIGRAVSSQR